MTRLHWSSPKSLTVPTTGSGPTAAQRCRIVETVKHSLEILAWGTMGCRGLSELHQMPQGQTVTPVNLSLLENTDATIRCRGKRKIVRKPKSNFCLTCPDIFEQKEFLARYARLLREGYMAWQQTGPVRDRKPLNAGQTKTVKQELSKLAPAS